MNSKAKQATWWDVPCEDKPKAKRVGLREGLKFLREGMTCGGYITVGMTATMLGITRQHVHNLLRQGKLFGRWYEGQWLVEGSSILDELERRVEKSGNYSRYGPEFASIRRLLRGLTKKPEKSS